MTTSTNSEKPKKFVVARVSLYDKAGWVDIHEYDNEQDAWIYCNMLNADTTMFHSVFEVD